MNSTKVFLFYSHIMGLVHILVHGFNGFTDDINPNVLSHYWGGDKLNIRQYLEENGYNSYEASISAFGSNYDRAVELYYYIYSFKS